MKPPTFLRAIQTDPQPVIPFYLAESAHVRLVDYDVVGRTVAGLYPEELGADAVLDISSFMPEIPD